MSNRKKKGILTVLLLSLWLACATLAVMHTTFSIPGRGRVKGIGVGIFWDQNCTQVVSEIDFSIIEPGETKPCVLHFRSKSNVNITLAMTTENWDPPNCTEYMRAGWNYTGDMLTPKSVIPIELYLQVYANVTGIDAFSFDIVIHGTG